MEYIYESEVDKERRERYKKQIKRYKKNSEALANEILLYEALKRSESSDDVIVWTLADEFIKNLEDNKVSLTLYGKSITDIIDSNYQTDEYQKIIRICDRLGYDDIISKLNEDYRLRELRKKYYNRNYSEFDIIKLLFEKSPEWILEIFASDADMNIKIQILIKVLSCIGRDDKDKIIKILTCDESLINELKRTDEKIIMAKVEMLKNEFRKENPSLQSMYEKLYLKKDGKELLIFLHQKGFIDLSKIIFETGKDKKLSISPVSLMALNGNLSDIEEYRNSKDYEFDSEITNNDDLFLIEQINYKELSKLIELPSFILTDVKVKKISEKLLSNYSNREEDEKLFETIKSTILHKAHNKKDYKELLRYTLLLDEIKRTKIEKQDTVWKYDTAKRILLKQLYELNEYAQENVPSRRLVKEVKFKQNML